MQASIGICCQPISSRQCRLCSVLDISSVSRRLGISGANIGRSLVQDPAASRWTSVLGRSLRSFHIRQSHPRQEKLAGGLPQSSAPQSQGNDLSSLRGSKFFATNGRHWTWIFWYPGSATNRTSCCQFQGPLGLRI